MGFLQKKGKKTNKTFKLKNHRSLGNETVFSEKAGLCMWVRDQNRLYLCKGQKVKHIEVLIHKACSATWLAAVSLSDTPLKHLSILALNLTSSSSPCPRNTNSNYHLLYTNRHMSDGMESYLLPCCNYIHYNGGKWIYTHSTLRFRGHKRPWNGAHSVLYRAFIYEIA